MVWIYPIEKDSNRSRPPRGTGRREPPLLGNTPTIFFSSRFTFIFFRSVSFLEWNRTTHSGRISSPNQRAQRKRIYSPTPAACQNHRD